MENKCKIQTSIKLSKNFRLYEFLKSQTATRLGIDNTPDIGVIIKLTALSNMVLQPIRDHYGRSVRINSGFRSYKLNEAIGGSAKSQHCKGEAADIEIDGLSNFELAQWIIDNLEFDQLILEGYDGSSPNSGWVHVSFKNDGTNRRKVMTAVFKNGKASYYNGLMESVA